MRPDREEEVFRGRLLTLSVEEWPAGRREVVHHPGACAVVALSPDEDVVLVRQVREAVRGRLLEIPAGILDVAGEDAAGCALRELTEETGYRAEEVEPLGMVLTSPGFTDERIELYLARGAVRSGDPEEGVEVVTMPFGEAVAAAREGRIEDAKTVVGLLLAAGRR